MLVIFDCDGVLVDSEVLVADVFSRGLADLGVSITAQECLQRFKGRSVEASMDELTALVGGPIDKSFFTRVQQQTALRFQSDLQSVKGIEAVLADLKGRGFGDCVASNGRHQKMRQSLHKTQLWSHFEGRIYSAEDVAEAKPAPDLFLYAARCQGRRVQECVVVEDSNSGVAAAIAANMSVLFYGQSSELDTEWRELGVVCFSRMDKLMPLLLQHCRQVEESVS